MKCLLEHVKDLYEMLDDLENLNFHLNECESEDAGLPSEVRDLERMIERKKKKIRKAFKKEIG